MAVYKQRWPEASIQTDVHIDSLHDFQGFLQHILDQDLPKFEERFQKSLREGAINDILLFRNKLDTACQDIENKIASINRNLHSIEYDRGVYIELQAEKAKDPEIAEFQLQLKKCMEQTIGEEHYSEDKYLQVKVILDRFNSADNMDKRWTKLVTDVRNWYIFNASIRYREDDSEKEFISDSAGKSGGQKEKLAYTILASALAYQFGLELDETRSRTFRFVVIDEAFGRGSDDSTRYGLELFKKLGLQLLIVTPLQKINIIENYINAVHFVANQDGRNSQVRNLSMAEYFEEKQRLEELESQVSRPRQMTGDSTQKG